MTEDNPIQGATIEKVRPMNEEELAREGWEHTVDAPSTALVLDSGVTLFASRDPVGNGPGALFGFDEEHNVCIYASDFHVQED